MYQRALFLSILAVCAALFCACTQTQPQTLLEISRSRNWNFQHEQSGSSHRIVFVPKGIWITGLTQNSAYAEGAWIRLMPGSEWPDDEPRPSLLIGRVAERQKSAARIEILALNAGMRSESPIFEEYSSKKSPSESLHAISKRLAFASGNIGKNDVALSLMSDEFIEGSEIYGAFDLDEATSGQRLANRCSAILSVNPQSSRDGAVHLKKLAGTLPKHPVFVLMDAPSAPLFDVEIKLFDQPNSMEILSFLQHIQDQELPGSQYIRLSQAKGNPAPSDALLQLGKPQTDHIEIDLISDHGSPYLIDQGNRVSSSPWTVVIDSNSPAEILAAAAAARAYTLLGYPASAAWILEQAWKDTDRAETRAAIAPALADAYMQLERGDWALEIALELRAYANGLSGKSQTMMQAAAAVVGAQSQCAPEFSDFFDAIYKNRSRLTNAWRRQAAHALLNADALPKSEEYFNGMKQNWNEFDEMRRCSVSGSEEICEDGLGRAETDIGRLWFYAALRMHHDDALELTRLAVEADSMGAPFLAMALWQSISELTARPNAESAYQAILQYARASQQIRPWLRGAVQIFKNGQPDASEIISALRGLDWRDELARLCIQASQNAGNDESIALLTFAAELFISNGDAMNAANTLNLLTKALEKAGQNTEAGRIKQRAQAFAKSTGTIHAE